MIVCHVCGDECAARYPFRCTAGCDGLTSELVGAVRAAGGSYFGAARALGLPVWAFRWLARLRLRGVG